MVPAQIYAHTAKNGKYFNIFYDPDDRDYLEFITDEDLNDILSPDFLPGSGGFKPPGSFQGPSQSGSSQGAAGPQAIDVNLCITLCG